uniref:Uncharacterized protein n=1 Tax=Timspurckia oligopyrenoides TaxID=708627 RepID=A0A7S1EUY5_9RHOD|mmetsp:Transcript_9314/g.16774  ORF Transcript_9314/g.16774 Transcript_9314/m.16774 type:complete len:333 (+) Transcript_9314:75-1073(+)
MKEKGKKGNLRLDLSENGSQFASFGDIGKYEVDWMRSELVLDFSTGFPTGEITESAIKLNNGIRFELFLFTRSLYGLYQSQLEIDISVLAKFMTWCEHFFKLCLDVLEVEEDVILPILKKRLREKKLPDELACEDFNVKFTLRMNRLKAVKEMLVSCPCHKIVKELLRGASQFIPLALETMKHKEMNEYKFLEDCLSVDQKMEIRKQLMKMREPFGDESKRFEALIVSNGTWYANDPLETPRKPVPRTPRNLLIAKKGGVERRHDVLKPLLLADEFDAHDAIESEAKSGRSFSMNGFLLGREKSRTYSNAVLKTPRTPRTPRRKSDITIPFV